MLKISSKYFLTPKKKDKILLELKNAIKNKEVDKELIPILRKFNKFNDIVSKFCCIGHDNFQRGYILFQVSEKLFKHILFNCGNNFNLSIYDAKMHGDIHFPDFARVTICWNSENEMKREIEFLRDILKEFYK